MSRQIESAAYHEAGHMTAAIVQAMPIRAKGLHVDMAGNGVAYYFDRPESDLGMTPLDMRERKLTIIALFAAHPAQLRFYPECQQNGWSKDLVRIETLSRQMHYSDEEGQIAIRKDLRDRANKLIDKHWLIVEGLAKTLLGKSGTPMSLEEINGGWGVGPMERFMSGLEIVEFFAKHNIRAKIVSDDARDYDSTQDVPHYDSLA